ncbi:MAG TPA: extracellular solute-binding protein [Candidatus Acidoferrales bacterium]|nr:extracellular solute-binding protein [Candidatus Acidoferrales bacterium]
MNKTTRRPSAAGLSSLALGLATFFLSTPSARAQSLDALYAKAKAEGSLILYTGGPTAPWDAAAKDFSARYPGVTVSVTGGFSNVLDKKIDAQLAAGKLEVDLAIFQTLQDFARWKQQGALLEFKPQGFDKIDASFRDPKGAFVAVQVNAHIYAYNPNFVKPEDVPRSALHFLNPLFRGKVVSCYPADDDATLYVFYNIVQKYGWSYMDRYMANQPNFIQGHLGVVRSIASGENLVTFDTIATISMDQKNLGLAQAVAFPQSDPLPIWPFTAAIFKSGPHPNAAKLFLTWYLLPEEQTKTGNWSPRSDVPAPYDWKPILSYKVVNNYRDFLADTTQLEQLRTRFETYTGPVKNVGGVR